MMRSGPSTIDRVGGRLANTIRFRSSSERFGKIGSTAFCVGLKLASGWVVPL